MRALPRMCRACRDWELCHAEQASGRQRLVGLWVASIAQTRVEPRRQSAPGFAGTHAQARGTCAGTRSARGQTGDTRADTRSTRG